MKKRAFITGITGQDGSYLAEYLLGLGYEVHGFLRRSSNVNTSNIDSLISNPDLTLHYGDLSDSASVTQAIARARPQEIYNLAAQSHVKVSFDNPDYTGDVNGLGFLRILEAVRVLRIEGCKIYQASTSELYGEVLEIPQTETTPFNAQSPYAIAKEYAFSMAKNYRQSYGMFISNGILFNHESPRRGHEFVTRKVTRAVAEFSCGARTQPLKLGNLNARRDWGHAKDYVRAQHLILQLEYPDDFVIATGRQYSIKNLVEISFEAIGIGIAWKGSGCNECGVVDTLRGTVGKLKVGHTVVAVDPQYFRPSEVNSLIGDPTKAQKILGWEAEYNFEKLIHEMVEADRLSLQ